MLLISAMLLWYGTRTINLPLSLGTDDSVKDRRLAGEGGPHAHEGPERLIEPSGTNAVDGAGGWSAGGGITAAFNSP